MRTSFIPDFDVSTLVPADYNPRKLDPKKFSMLQESIKRFGIIKPLIVNGANNVLTAGHQRTRAIRSLGIKTAPVIRIDGISQQDEIQFNLFHNSVETNSSKVRVEGPLPWGYCVITPDRIHYEKNNAPTVTNAMGRLILRYGEWGSIVCDQNGRVLLNSDYAVISKELGTEVICYVIDAALADELLHYLSVDYGQYYYETLGIKSYNQLYCQKNRLAGKSSQKSRLYEGVVLPELDRSKRMLDFGAGKCAYVNVLKAQGVPILAYEPNYQVKQNLALKEVVKMIKAIEADVQANGLYDRLVLDSVLNSVVNSEVEDYVLTTCNSFMKSDGVFYTATRNLLAPQKQMTFKKDTGKVRRIEFLDPENFCATFRNGLWTMQHFHTAEGLRDLLLKYFHKVELCCNEADPMLSARAQYPRKLDLSHVEKALEFELNMEYPHGYRHNQHLALKQSLLDLLKERTEYAE